MDKRKLYVVKTLFVWGKMKKISLLVLMILFNGFVFAASKSVDFCEEADLSEGTKAFFREQRWESSMLDVGSDVFVKEGDVYRRGQLRGTCSVAIRFGDFSDEELRNLEFNSCCTLYKIDFGSGGEPVIYHRHLVAPFLRDDCDHAASADVSKEC